MSIAPGTPVDAAALAALLPALTPYVGVPADVAARGDAGLTGLGWVGATGATAAGRDLAAELADAPELTVRAQDATGGEVARVLVGRTSLLVVEGLPGGVADRDVRVQRLPVSALPLVLGHLIGLRPTDVVEGGEFELDRSAVDARVSAVSTPVPADAPAWLRRAWAQPWRRWRIDAADGPHLHYIDTGEAGQIAVLPRGRGRVTLVLRPEGLIWGELQAVPRRLRPAADVDPDSADW